jgi:hypothetical protein
VRPGRDRAESRDGVGEGHEGAVIAGRAAGARANRVHVAQHGVEALVGRHAETCSAQRPSHAIVPAGWRDDVDLVRRVNHGAHPRRQLSRVGERHRQ